MRTILIPIFFLVTACGVQTAPEVPGTATSAVTAVDSARVVDDLRFLSSRELAGRGIGTAGNRQAREYIQRELAAVGVAPLEGGWLQNFRVGDVDAANVIGHIRGTERPGRAIVVTAHYDHLGIRNGEIYHGADDNASGTAALLEIARQFAENPPRHSIVFAALDAEESGLRGARAFVADPPLSLDSVLVNVNMDMVSRNEAGELYIAGTYHYPALIPAVDAVAARSEITLRRGHDSPDLSPRDDWTLLSDHGAFHQVGIPFAYFGVEDHPDYHSPTDTFENTDPAFFVRAVATILDFIREIDRIGLPAR